MSARPEWQRGLRAAGAEFPCGDEFLRTLFDNLYDGVYFVDRYRRILCWNKGAERISGYTAEEVVGRCCADAILDHVDDRGCHLCEGSCPLALAIREGVPSSVRAFLRHKDGRRIAADVHVMPVPDERGGIAGGVEVFRDASSVVALENAYGRMRELAEKDPLTGVANRRQLDAILRQQADLLQTTGIPFAVVLSDLDHFKAINDRWGHATGDAVLARFAATIQGLCRPSELVGRYGGEEFLVILPGLGLDRAGRIAERMRARTHRAAPPELGGRRLTASFGVAEARPGEAPEAVVRRADRALYRAKRAGRDRVAIDSGAEPDCRARVCPTRA